MSVAFEIVRVRPGRRRTPGQDISALERAVSDTVSCGGAVKVPLDGRLDFRGLQARLAHRLGFLRVTVRHVPSQRAAYIWAEID